MTLREVSGRVVELERRIGRRRNDGILLDKSVKPQRAAQTIRAATHFHAITDTVAADFGDGKVFDERDVLENPLHSAVGIDGDDAVVSVPGAAS